MKFCGTIDFLLRKAIQSSCLECNSQEKGKTNYAKLARFNVKNNVQSSQSLARNFPSSQMLTAYYCEMGMFQGIPRLCLQCAGLCQFQFQYHTKRNTGVCTKIEHELEHHCKHHFVDCVDLPVLCEEETFVGLKFDAGHARELYLP